MSEVELWPITYSEVSDQGFIGVQFQMPGPDGKNASHLCQTLQPYGFFSCPLDPVKDDSGNLDAGQAAQGLVIWRGGEAFVLPCADPRMIATLPNITKGDVGFAAGKRTFMRARADGSLTRYTTDDGTTSGKTVYDQVYPGGRIFMSPLGTMKHDKTGYHLTTWGGARLDMGKIGGGAIPDALSSYFRVQAATISFKGSMIRAGNVTAAPVASAVALANFLYAFATTLVPGGAAALTAALAAAAANAGGAPVLNPAAQPIYQVLATKNFVAS